MKKLAFAALLGLISWVLPAAVWAQQAVVAANDQMAAPTQVAATSPSTAAVPPAPVFFESKYLAGGWEIRGTPYNNTASLMVVSDDGKGKAIGKFTVASSSTRECAGVKDLLVDITYNPATAEGRIDNQPQEKCERHWTLKKVGPDSFEGKSLMGTEVILTLKGSSPG